MFTRCFWHINYITYRSSEIWSSWLNCVAPFKHTDIVVSWCSICIMTKTNRYFTEHKLNLLFWGVYGGVPKVFHWHQPAATGSVWQITSSLFLLAQEVLIYYWTHTISCPTPHTLHRALDVITPEPLHSLIDRIWKLRKIYSVALKSTLFYQTYSSQSQEWTSMHEFNIVRLLV